MLVRHATPPRLDEAEKDLAAAREAHPTELAVERGDYLAVWLADARGADSDRVIALARDFLRIHPRSPLAGEVRLKLAESHFRRQDFASAQTEFETLAQENPKSSFTEQALFLAAQSAMASMARYVVIEDPAEKYIRIRQICKEGQSVNCEKSRVYYCPNLCYETKLVGVLAESH